MIDSHEDALKAIHKLYSSNTLSLKPYGSDSAVIEDGLTILEDGKFKHVEESGGEYSEFDFIDPASVIYKLVIIPKNHSPIRIGFSTS